MSTQVLDHRVARGRLAGLSNHPERNPERIAEAKLDLIAANCVAKAERAGLAQLDPQRRAAVAAAMLAGGRDA